MKVIVPMPMLRIIALPALVLLSLMLTACGDRQKDQRQVVTGSDNEALPAPEAASGVTGTADVTPGAGDRSPLLGEGPQPVQAVDPDLVIQDGVTAIPNPETGQGIDPDGDGPLTAPPTHDNGAGEPTSVDAVALVRDYYAAINARDFAKAYPLWAGNGSASGQTAQQFVNGFAHTQGVSVRIGAPGNEDAGAGQRYIEVPITLDATQADGSVRRYAGRYVLRRAVVDGATTEQRSWRIQSGDLREVQP